MVVLTVCIGRSSLSSAALITSTFDSGDDGWTIRTVVNGDPPTVAIGSFAPTFVPTGGNPGGYIQTGDPDGNATVFVAPSGYLGDMSAYYGGTLSFDTRDTENDGIPGVLAVLVGTDRTLYSAFAGPPSTTDWTGFSLSLSASDWRLTGILDAQLGPPASASDMTAVLGDLQELYIYADWNTGGDLTDLDNVRLESSAVPEPASMALLGLTALGGIGLRMRQRRKAQDAQSAA